MVTTGRTTVGKVAIAFVVIATVGCTRLGYGGPDMISPSRYTHDSKTMADFEKDRYECQRENRGVKRVQLNYLRDQCMLVRGWQRAGPDSKPIPMAPERP